MTSTNRRLLIGLLVVASLPGWLLLLRDLLEPSPEDLIGRARRWHPYVEGAANRFAVDPALVTAVIIVESKGETSARSRPGATGLMQLMPTTAEEVAAKIGLAGYSHRDLTDGKTNILLGTAYLAEQLDSFGGNEPLALAAYNAGPGRVRRWIRENPGLTGPELVRKAAFPETKAYVARVLGYRDLVRETSTEKR